MQFRIGNVVEHIIKIKLFRTVSLPSIYQSMTVVRVKQRLSGLKLL